MLSRENYLRMKEDLIKEKEDIDKQIKFIDEILSCNEPKEINRKLKVDFYPWHHDPLWQIADIIRTTPFANQNYPFGFNCDVCRMCGNECTCELDGIDCNWAFIDFFKKEMKRRQNKEYGE